MPGTPTVRFAVANLDQWGRLVKSWATHLDYISVDYPNQPPRTYWFNQTWPSEQGRTPGPATVTDRDPNTGAPLPWCLPQMHPVNVRRPDGAHVAVSAVAMTVDDFKTRVGNANVTITSMPAEYTNVVVVQGSPNTMVLRIPPTDTLESSEDDLLNGVTYEIPAFYWTLFPGGKYSPPTTYPEIMKLHAYRIGEYTLNVCN